MEDLSNWELVVRSDGVSFLSHWELEVAGANTFGPVKSDLVMMREANIDLSDHH